MIKHMFIPLVVVFLGCNEAAKHPEPSSHQPQAQSSTSATAHWPDRLIGRWEGTVEGDRYVEEWKRGCGNNYDGRSEMWQGEKMLGSENMRITEFVGQWMFMASPDAQHVTAFQLENNVDNSWTFANEEHDFPQRISYTIKDDSLKAWIEGPRENGSARMNFDLVRIE